jgi:Ran GTPase-activating protein (RanGAP) involved in mRNA processing and transport
MRDQGVGFLADAIKVNSALQVITLWDMQLDRGKWIAEALEKNSSLKEISLWENSIGDDGAKCMAEAIKRNSTLQKIDISSIMLELKAQNGYLRQSRRILRCR